MKIKLEIELELESYLFPGMGVNDITNLVDNILIADDRWQLYSYKMGDSIGDIVITSTRENIIDKIKGDK